MENRDIGFHTHRCTELKSFHQEMGRFADWKVSPTTIAIAHHIIDAGWKSPRANNNGDRTASQYLEVNCEQNFALLRNRMVDSYQ